MEQTMRIRWNFFLLIVLIGLMPSLHAFLALKQDPGDPYFVQINGEPYQLWTGQVSNTDNALIGAISNNEIGREANNTRLTYLQQTTRKYDHRSVALSSALTALPTNGGTGSHACGVGAGVRGEYSAMALGCAADLANFDLSKKLPAFVRHASINAGTSFLAHDDPDYTFKVGMTFNFGKSKSNMKNSHASLNNSRPTAENKNFQTPNKNASAIKELKRENLKLQAQINVLKSSNTELLMLKEQVAQLSTLFSSYSRVAAK
jgi:hypothetical protein